MRCAAREKVFFFFGALTKKTLPAIISAKKTIPVIILASIALIFIFNLQCNVFCSVVTLTNDAVILPEEIECTRCHSISL